MAVWVRDKSFYKTLIMLALPMMFQALVAFGINFADNIMVGRLGAASVAGVYLGGQIQGFLTMVVAGLEGGALVLAAQYWGRRDVSSIREIVSMAIRISVAVGVVFWAASFFFPAQVLGLLASDAEVIFEGVKYLRILSFSFLFFSISQILISSLRSVETVSIGLWLSILSFFLNVVLNYIFIFGTKTIAPMGVAGAALATSISRGVEMVIVLLYVFGAEQKLRLRPKHFKRINPVLLKDYVRYGLPLMGGQVVWSANMLAQSWIIGRLGVEALAAVSVSNILFSLIYVSMSGLSSAVSIITGKTVGAGKFELMKQYARTVQALFLCVGVISGVSVWFVKDLFLSFYNFDAQTIAVARQFLTVISITIAGTSYQAACLFGLVKAGGDTGFVFLNDTIFVFGVVLPSALIALFVFHAPAWVVFACLKSDQILKCFVAVVKINRFRWMKNLTRQFAQEG